MNRYILPKVVSGLCCLALFAASEGVAQAQCDTCATPVVAYQPVAVQPTVTYTPYTGWYPGKWLDNMRMRRYGYSAPTTYTAAYAPYTASYAPTYSSTYAPYAASYAPYSASYAPSYSTSYYAPTSMYSPYVTAYAPLGQRQVLMRPVVVASPVISGGCNTCAALESPCSTCEAAPACSACSGSAAYAGSVEPATYVEPACSSCAAGSGSVTYPAPSGSSQMAAPSLLPQEAAPQQSNYPPITPPVTPGLRFGADRSGSGSGGHGFQFEYLLRSSQVIQPPRPYGPIEANQSGPERGCVDGGVRQAGEF